MVGIVFQKTKLQINLIKFFKYFEIYLRFLKFFYCVKIEWIGVHFQDYTDDFRYMWKYFVG